MLTRLNHRILIFALILLSANLFVQAEDLCMEGTLLFREDFGGNDPNDPVAGTDPAPGMTSNYMQIFDTATCIAHYPCTGMGSGRYLLTKIGYRNAASYTYSHWFIMDDHTFPNDYTRGYLLEIDGRTDNATLFETVINGLCEGTKLTFSAYVTNITTAYSYDHGNNGDPQLSFVLQDPVTGAELITPYKTGPIPVDRSYQGIPYEWRNSAHWQLVGMNFTVPAGRTAIKLLIKNACTASGGNDFAMDDIEIRLCAPPVTIDGEAEVCEKAATSLSADFTNDGTFAEPLEYKWWHSEDSVTWTELSETTALLSLAAVQKSDSGWYKVAVSGADNIASVNCRAESAPFRLKVKECAPPELEYELCMDGILLFREDFGGNDVNDPKISTTPVPDMSYNQLLDDYFGVMRSGSYLVTKSGYCNGDTSITNLPQNRGSQWHLQDDHTYPNDKTRGYLLEIDGRGDNAAFYRTTIDHLCEGIELTFSAYVANVMTWGQYVGSPGRYSYPRLIFKLTNPQNNTELATYDTGDIPFDSAFINDYNCWKESSKWNLVGMNFVVPVGVETIQLSIYNNATGYIGNDFAIDDIEIHLCMTPDTIRTDTIVCDTISQILWRDSLYQIADTLRDTLRSTCGFDSIYYVMKVGTKVCCPDLHYATRDTIVCDTLMPFTWYGLLFDAPGSQMTIEKDERGCDTLQTTWTLNTKFCCPDLLTVTADTVVCDTLMPYRWRDTLFTEPATYEILYKDQRDCDSVLYILSLDTIHCERFIPEPDPEPEPEPEPEVLYPIIVNKYNWQLLLDNVTLRQLFPNRTATAYQWYKNDQAIDGATEDDYSEQNELHGVFQLQVTLDGSQLIWSNILSILDSEAEVPVETQIYNWQHLYLIRYEQGDKVWVEKKLIP